MLAWEPELRRPLPFARGQARFLRMTENLRPMPSTKPKSMPRRLPRRRAAAAPTGATVSRIPSDPLAGKLVVRPKEAWDIIRCGHSKGWELVKEGRLTAIRVGNMTLIHTHSIRELLGLPATP
jgi:hypothetical protein